MAFTIGSGTFTNGSATVTGVTLTSGTLAYFASGTRMVVGVNPVVQEVEAIAAPSVSTITLRSAWTGTGGTYAFLANQTSEGLRDAVQAIRTNNASLQSFIDSIDTAATANSVAQRDSSGQLTATNLITADKIIHDGDTNTAIRFPAADTVTVETDGAERVRVDSTGNVGIGTSSPAVKFQVETPSDGDSSWVLTKRGGTELYAGISSSFGASIESNDTLRFATGASFLERMRIDSSGNVLAGGDNTQTLGGASNRWSVVYAGTGTINTSDAREKTPVNELTADELNAAKQLSKEIGTYQFLSAVAKKGDDARKHVGMTVQRAIEIMEANNLDPFAYGFICYDEWEEKTVEHPAVEAVDGKEAWTETVEHEAELDENGEVIKEACVEVIEHEAVEAVEAKEAYTEVTQEAGNRYSFRPDEMLFFIARGLEARIEALEG